MSSIDLRIVDVTGSRSCEVQVPDDVPLDRLLVLLVERMELPVTAPDGQVIAYKLNHRNSGRQLLDAATLEESGVRDGDELRLQPEITAGAA